MFAAPTCALARPPSSQGFDSAALCIGDEFGVYRTGGADNSALPSPSSTCLGRRAPLTEHPA